MCSVRFLAESSTMCVRRQYIVADAAIDRPAIWNVDNEAGKEGPCRHADSGIWKRW